MEAAAWLDLTNSESPEFVGRAVAALAADPNVMRHTGTVRVAAGVAIEYGFKDIDGKTPSAAHAGRRLSASMKKRLASHHSAEPGTLVVRCAVDERELMLEEAPDTYYVTDYYRPYPGSWSDSRR